MPTARRWRISRKEVESFDPGGLEPPARTAGGDPAAG